MSSYDNHNLLCGCNFDVYKKTRKMNIEKLLDENLESFYPWSDEENPPLDTNKTFVQKQKEIDEIFEGWRASM